MQKADRSFQNGAIASHQKPYLSTDTGVVTDDIQIITIKYSIKTCN